MRCFAFRLEPYPIPDPPSTHQTRYTQSPHPAGQIERLRFVQRRLMGLVVIPRPAVAGGIAERSLERRHARDALSVNPIRNVPDLPCATRAARVVASFTC